MRAGFTPGPWSVGERRFGGSTQIVYAQFKGLVCEVQRPVIKGIADDEGLTANARLIAAAPELYEALHDLLQTADEEGHYHDLNDGVVDKAERVLAKARGVSA